MPLRQLEAARAVVSQRLDGVRAEQHNFDIAVVTVRLFGLSVGSQRGVVVPIERIDVRQPMPDVVGDEEVVDLCWSHKL